MHITAIDSEDLPTNTSQNEHFQDVVNRAVSRRGFLKFGSGAAVATFLAGPLAACGGNASTASLLGFKAVAASSADTVVVAEGYTATAFVPWGTPLFSTGEGSTWAGDGSESAAAQARQVGDNHDGIHFFPIDGASSSEGLLVMNHEYNTTLAPGYTNYLTLFGSTPAPADTLERVNKAINSWGCSVIHIRKTGSSWSVVRDSDYNRRITAATPMQLTGPAAGDTKLRTSADATGTEVLGTINNCGNGYTPWGTYLTCEENFNNNFGTVVNPSVDGRTAAMVRYGITAGTSGYGWEAQHSRFDYKSEPNEANRFGWIVEIDPFDPTSKPKKRTALGRFKHENAAYAFTRDKRVVIYMGDDQANDYIYKFVSTNAYIEGNQRANANLLDSGKLYVAKFNDGATSGDYMGTGQWVELNISNASIASYGSYTFSNQADVLIHARIAGDAVGATKMDRPEWVAVHPTSGEVYVTLTNNSSRSSVNDANPRTSNIYGQIVRWRETGGDAAATTFDWDIFVLAGNPTVQANQGTLKVGSSNVTADNTFNSPDGLGFDRFGRLWIQTDGKYSNTGDYANQGNNQMLVADPVSKEIRRFLVGPKECEVTGLTFTPDNKTLFINIQHPGENGGGSSHWPEGGSAIPRSATVIITKNDGGVIGT